jgi:ParB family chromosome partitioning protein
MASNKKLGKGLSSLLGNRSDLSFDQQSENGLLLIPIENIFRDENQPRKEFDKEKIEELAQSINKNGLIQPLILTKKGDNNYVIVAGERRWRAAQIANLKNIPSLLLPEDLDKDEISLIENIQRENLKISEEAQAYQKLIDKNNYTHEELSKIIGKSRPHITNLLRILNLDPYFFDLLNRGMLTMGHARALVGKRPEDFDEKILNQITFGNISVRDIEKNKSRKKVVEPNLLHEENNLSKTLGFKSKITYSKSGKGNIKIFFNNLEQYNFIVNKLKN